MLVIISDLHLTDGSTGMSIGASAFDDFRARLEEFAIDASHRSNGQYVPIEQFDLILLGDILDIIRSRKWTAQQEGEDGYVRPWHNPHSPLYINKIDHITEAILNHNAEALQILKGLSTDNPITIPHPTEPFERVEVQAHIYYIIGNHDWFYHLSGADYERIRQKIRDAMGLSNPPGPFPHDPAQFPWLMDIYGSHQVFARHGDIYDPFNYDKKAGRNVASLGDAFVVEVINRFPEEVDKRMHNQLPKALLQQLNELATIRPSLLVPLWVDTLLKTHKVGPQQKHEVKKIWDEVTKHFLSLDFVRKQGTLSPFDAVDLLRIVLKLYNSVSLAIASRVVLFIEKKVWGGETSFADHALNEPAFKERQAQHIIYGHTHHYEMVPLDKTQTSQGPFDQYYYNSGTWHPLHTLVKARNDTFIHFNVMTFIAFFKGDERKGRPFETWSGTLGVRPKE